MDGDYAYLADGYDGVRIVNVSDPRAPYLVGTYTPGVKVLGVRIRWPYAYVAAGTSGMIVLDVSIPSNPILTSTYTRANGNFQDVELYGNYALLADNANDLNMQQKSLRIVDISNPKLPYEAAAYLSYLLGDWGYPQSVMMNGSNALFVTDTGLLIIDLSNPLSPKKLSRYTPTMFNYDVTSVDQYMVLPHEFGIDVVDIANPNSPVRISKVNTPGDARGAAFVQRADYGRLIYVADGNGGLQIIDANSIEYPFLTTGNYDSVTSYDVQVIQKPNGSFQPWITGTQNYFGQFTGENGKEYCFRLQAHDKGGNTSDGYFTSSCTTIKAPDISLSGLNIDDDISGDSFGNGDGMVNPGEFIELQPTLQNLGLSDAQNLEITVSTNDSCVLNNGVFSYDQNLDFGNLTVGASVTANGYSIDDLDLGVSSDCANGHVIAINLSIRENVENGNSWTRTLNVPVSGLDTTNPQLIFADVTPKALNPGEPVLITVFVREPAPYLVAANIYTGGNHYRNVFVNDNGTNGDAVANDHWYTTQWTPDKEDDFTVGFEALDQPGNYTITAGLVHFSTKPFIARNKLLLVYDRWDYDYDDPEYLSYYTDTLHMLNFEYDIWNTAFRGPVPVEVLSNYIGGSVVWAMPSMGYLGFMNEQQLAVQKYLDLGGRLLMTGQYIGPYLTNNGTQSNTFHGNYLHSNYVTYNSGTMTLQGVKGDPISEAQSLTLNSGDSANNQFWPTVVEPLYPAVPIYYYSSGTVVSTGSIRPAVSLSEANRQSAEFIRAPGIPDPLNPTHPAAQALQTVSNPVAGLRVDTGVYKLVYLAFGFEGINGEDGSNRLEVMSRVLNWLMPNHSPETPFAPYPTQLPSLTGVTSSTLLEIAPNEAVLWWQGKDIDPGDSLRYDVYLGTTPSLGAGDLLAANLYIAWFDPGLLRANQVYYWKVVAKDSHGAETSSPLWSFKTNDQGIYNLYLPSVVR